MNRFYILFLLFTISFYSCKPIYKGVNGINKEIEFTSLNDYKDFINKTTSLDSEKILVVKEQDYNDLIFDVMKRRVVYYYGIFDNDRLVANGSDLKDKNSCFGSISSVINKSIDSSSSGVYQSSPLSDFSYYNLDGVKVELDFSKHLIVYTYSYKLGKLSKNLDKLILDLKNNNLSYNFIIISLDNIASKKN
ncbi:MAG: hypothetical protein CMC76_01730 [Flavobacteriaceae bacterium]|nr:hypothetical protein [Flavobacteriaceae bacterium]